MELAVEYAYANPALPGQEAWEPAARRRGWRTGPHLPRPTEDVEWYGLPALRWDAPAAFAAANGMSTAAGKALIRDALVLTTGLPRSGPRCAPDDHRVAGPQDRPGAPRRAGGRVPLRRRCTGRAPRGRRRDRPRGRRAPRRRGHAPAARRGARARPARGARPSPRHLDPASINHNGIADLDARLDCVDLLAVDQTVAELAEALKDLPEYEHESLDVRRSIALGILADPARAQALLDGDRRQADSRPASSSPTSTSPRGTCCGRPRRHRRRPPAHLAQVIRRVGRPPRHRPNYPRPGLRRDGGCTHCPARSTAPHDACPRRLRPHRCDRRSSSCRTAAASTPTAPVRPPLRLRPHQALRLGRPDLPQVQPRTPLPTSPPAQDPRRLALLEARHQPTSGRPPRTPLPPRTRRHPPARLAESPPEVRRRLRRRRRAAPPPDGRSPRPVRRRHGSAREAGRGQGLADRRQHRPDVRLEQRRAQARPRVRTPWASTDRAVRGRRRYCPARLARPPPAAGRTWLRRAASSGWYYGHQ